MTRKSDINGRTSTLDKIQDPKGKRDNRKGDFSRRLGTESSDDAN